MNSKKTRKTNRARRGTTVTKTVTTVASKPRPGNANQVKRKRTRKRNNMVGVTTIDNIERQLARTNISRGVSLREHPYVRCRLDPFGHSGSNGIPDGGNSQFIVVDNLLVENITATDTGGFIINTQSWLPAMARFTAKSQSAAQNGFIVNGFPSGPPPGSVVGINSWIPMSVPSPYTRASPYTPGVHANDPYISTTARLVAVQYKLTYTGTPLSCQGTYTITPNTAALNVRNTVTAISPNPGIGQLSVNVNNVAGAPWKVALGTPVYDVDVEYGPTAYNKDSVLCRQERPIVITPKHSTSDFKLSATMDIPVAATNGDVTGDPAINYMAGLNGNAYSSGILWYDNDWQHYQISVDGYQAGATFVWETSCCFEYVLSNVSAFAPLSKARSENHPAAIREANRLVDLLPAAGRL